MKEELKKSLTDLIDETLLELEELKKSRFSAAEIDLKGPGSDEMAGKPVNGKLAEKADDEEDAEDEEEDDAEKSEGVNAAADVSKAEDKKDDKDDKDDKKDEPHKDDPKHEEKEKDMAKKLLDMHKSAQEAETLMKSYVDQKVDALEGKLAAILDTVTKMADAPVPSKGASYKEAAPLMKSSDVSEPLSKSEVASKLFELKKSGSRVDSNDIAMAEMGHDLEKIVSKYGVK
jgi:hypothetical protein